MHHRFVAVRECRVVWPFYIKTAVLKLERFDMKTTRLGVAIPGELHEVGNDGFMMSVNSDVESRKLQMLAQLKWMQENIESGEIRCFMACGVVGNDSFGQGLAPTAGRDLISMHNAICALHEQFHDGMEAASKFVEEQERGTND